MESEVTVTVRALVSWHIEDGQPVVDDVVLIGQQLESLGEALAAVPPAALH